MPWVSKEQLDGLHNQIDHWIERFGVMELESTYWQAKALAADKEVRALNKAVKNKHKLKTALREANKKHDQLLVLVGKKERAPYKSVVLEAIENGVALSGLST